MLARVGGFRPQESIFEIASRRGGRKNQEEAVDEIRKIRLGLETKRQRSLASHSAGKIQVVTAPVSKGQELVHGLSSSSDSLSMASDSELEVTFSNSKLRTTVHGDSEPADLAQAFRDSENFMSYHPTNYNLSEEKAYGVQGGTDTNFTEAARGATMDLGVDESAKGFGEARGIMRWDKRHKKYVSRQNDDDGSKGKRLVRGESGAKIAASFRSGRYDAWKKANKIGRSVRTGAPEVNGGQPLRKQFRHKAMRTPQAADKYREDYEKQKKKISAAKERQGVSSHGRQEIRSLDDIRKQRNVQEKRKEKNARPSRKGRK